MTQLLSVQNLSVGFGRGNAIKPIVDGVSFTLDAGETLAIVGESGSGKSVTALSINRLIDYSGGKITSGRIDLSLANGDTLDIAALDTERMEHIRGREIGMIFQEPMTSLNPVLTIGRQIEEVFRLQGRGGREARAETLRALDRMRIPDAARRLGYYPHQLSGGMLQRVMIAMALAASPRLLIADEPTTALDVSVQAQIIALLASDPYLLALDGGLDLELAILDGGDDLLGQVLVDALAELGLLLFLLAGRIGVLGFRALDVDLALGQGQAQDFDHRLELDLFLGREHDGLLFILELEAALALEVVAAVKLLDGIVDRVLHFVLVQFRYHVERRHGYSPKIKARSD